MLRYLHDFVGVEIEADNSVVGLGVGGFFFDGEAVAIGIELGDAVALRVIHPIAEDGGFAQLLGLEDGVGETLGEA